MVCNNNCIERTDYVHFCNGVYVHYFEHFVHKLCSMLLQIKESYYKVEFQRTLNISQWDESILNHIPGHSAISK